MSKTHKDIGLREIKKLSRIRIGTLPRPKVIKNKKRFNRKKEKELIKEQLLDYYNGGEF